MTQEEIMKAIKAIHFHLVFLNPRLTPEIQKDNEAVMELAAKLEDHLEKNIVGQIKLNT
jgi:hypothetical protein